MGHRYTRVPIPFRRSGFSVTTAPRPTTILHTILPDLQCCTLLPTLTVNIYIQYPLKGYSLKGYCTLGITGLHCTVPVRRRPLSHIQYVQCPASGTNILLNSHPSHGTRSHLWKHVEQQRRYMHHLQSNTRHRTNTPSYLLPSSTGAETALKSQRRLALRALAESSNSHYCTTQTYRTGLRQALSFQRQNISQSENADELPLSFENMLCGAFYTQSLYL